MAQWIRRPTTDREIVSSTLTGGMQWLLLFFFAFFFLGALTLQKDKLSQQAKPTSQACGKVTSPQGSVRARAVSRCLCGIGIDVDRNGPDGGKREQCWNNEPAELASLARWVARPERG